MKEVNNEGFVSGVKRGIDAVVGPNSRFMSIVNRAQANTNREGPLQPKAVQDRKLAKASSSAEKEKSTATDKPKPKPTPKPKYGSLLDVPSNAAFVGNDNEIFKYDPRGKVWVNDKGKRVRGESGLRIYNQQQQTRESVEESFGDKELSRLRDMLNKLLK